MTVTCLIVSWTPLKCFSQNFLGLFKSPPTEILQRYIDRPKTLKRAHIGEGPCSLNSITTALYTIHKRQRCTGCSFQLLFPQIPIEISFGRTMHFFPFEKKERKSISGFNTCGSRSIPAPALFFSATLFLQCSLHLWKMVNRNNGVWLLEGQGAAGGENKAADESAWAGITRASMPLTSLWSGMDKRAGKTHI